MLNREISLGKIFGIEIAVDYSWFVIFILVTTSFSMGIMPLIAPELTTIPRLLYGAFGALLFFASVLLHELSHTLTARLYKLPVRKITLFLFGGISNLLREPWTPLVELKMAAAGPLASLLLGIVMVVIGESSIRAGFQHSILVLMEVIGLLNIGLAVFNLLPGFPLDGGRILRSFIWWRTGNRLKATSIATNAGKIVAGALMLYGIWQLLTANIFGGVWLLFVGYFLYQSADASYFQEVISERLKEVEMKEIMNTELGVVQSQTEMEGVLRTAFDERKEVFLVFEDEKIVGVITPAILQNAASVKYQSAGEASTKIENIEVVRLDDTANIALEKLNSSENGLVLIKEDSGYKGSITLLDIRDYLRYKSSDKTSI